ncbi:MAG: diphthine synthase [Euryarchaeota archaeon]|nr:diphthine synthase [Euryarchaeota archaeon]
MLFLIGLGLTGDDIPHSGIETARKCSKIYCEAYTNFLGIKKEKFESILGSEVVFLQREDVEEKTFIIEEAERGDVAFLVGGDPLAATTHVDLVLQAWKRGVKVKVIHAASVFSAIGETGLQLYKFGKTVSIVYPEEKFFPKSFYKTILSNRKRGLHTLLLLDIKAEKERYMSPNEAFEIINTTNKKKVIEKAVVISRLGKEDQMIVYGSTDKLRSCAYGDPPHCIVIPGKLHFLEKEYLSYYEVCK